MRKFFCSSLIAIAIIGGISFMDNQQNANAQGMYESSVTDKAAVPNLKKEEEYYRSKNSDFVLLIGWFLTRTVNLCRRIVDCFCSPPREVCIYRGDEEVRSAEMVEKPTCLWRMNKQNN